ncbi:hypothetical protein QUB05_01900 [Microcoleus sp. F10-C6]|uniref:hypothetical protein n=1 Tax=unclassified Microcoleus TaxID=2642155 RepID=UPI002FD0D989
MHQNPSVGLLNLSLDWHGATTFCEGAIARQRYLKPPSPESPSATPASFRGAFGGSNRVFD